MKEKAGRNKTIDLQIDEGRTYLDRCVRTGSVTDSIESVTDQFILGDCFETMDRMRQIGSFADLLIADPPYNLDKDYNGNRFNKKSFEEYREFTKAWLEKALPLLKPSASVYVCCDWRSGLVIGEVLQEYLYVRNRITWQREKGRGARANWKNGMEDIWFATMGNEYTFNLESVKIRRKVLAPYRIEGKPKDWEETGSGNYRNTCPSNFWDDVSVPYWSMPENTAHPTQKPEKLIAKLILASSNEGDIILDPFAGSGTTAVTAKKLKRRFVAIEQNELYGVWAQKRLEMADSDPWIQGYRDGVFWERNSQEVKKHQKKSKNRTK